MKNNLLVSFSGGETSAMMTRMLLTKWRDRYREIVVVFANTGQENEQTLEFVRDCDRHFGFGTVWVEAVVNPTLRKGTTHKIVDFGSASRMGEPFEAVIRKFGIPNQKFGGCSRELKRRPIDSYVRSLGWRVGSYDIAIGIRADEASRRSADTSRGIVYPLLDWEPVTKPDVNTFWASQPFRLRLMGFQGNCKACWKKSFRKLLTIMAMTPEAFEFTERMERKYPHVGPEFRKAAEGRLHSPLPEGYRRTFFRGNLSTKDLRRMLKVKGVNPAQDDAVIYSGRVLPLDGDVGGGCAEHCEPMFDGKRGRR